VRQRTIKDMLDIFHQIASNGYSLNQVYSDFLEITAISFRTSVVDEKTREKIEEQYSRFLDKYKADNMKLFAKVLAVLVELQEQEYRDYLGELASEVAILSNKKGQVFTPLHISDMMVKMTLNQDSIKKAYKEQGYITILEPSAGTGAFLVSIARQGIKGELPCNFQKEIKIQAWELDRTVFFGLYIQACLLGLDAEIINGNTLTREVYERWITPVSHINRMESIISNIFTKPKEQDIFKDSDVKLDRSIKDRIAKMSERLKRGDFDED